MKPCRECGHEVSEQAFQCPHCGAPYPARAQWDGYGFEYKSSATLYGLPLVHISFKYRPNRVPVPARGVLAIGQFGIGIITIAQFGVGVITVAQFGAGVFALAQFALAYTLIAQLGLYLHSGRGQMILSLLELIRHLTRG